MTDPQWRVLAPIVAADWLAGDPGAVDRARALAEHAADTGEVAELVTALLDCLGIALGQVGNLPRARRRLEDRALAVADRLLDSAIDAGSWRHREGQ